MTHPLRNEPPYAPKVGEMWINGLWKTPAEILEVNEYYAVAKNKRSGRVINFFGTGLIRRHFRDQSERDNAPAIPPVEGARMVTKDGYITKPLKILSSGNFSEINRLGEGLTGYEWTPDGREVVQQVLPNLTSATTIAVHRWGEDVTNGN